MESEEQHGATALSSTQLAAEPRVMPKKQTSETAKKVRIRIVSQRAIEMISDQSTSMEWGDSCISFIKLVHSFKI